MHANRTVLIPPGSVGALSAYRTVSTDIAKIAGTAPINVDALLAGSIMQAGVERFLVYGDDYPDDEATPSKFITDRTSTINPPKINELYRTIHDVFESQRISDEDRNSPSHSLAGLIVDLIIAAKFKTSLILASPPSDISEAQDSFRPEFYGALEHFFAAAERGAASLPMPRTIIQATQINRLKSILESDLFTAYSDSHTNLEDPGSSMDGKLRRVDDTARNLTRGFSDYLSLSSLLLSGMTLTSKVVEVFLGSLPSAALKPIQKMFESYFADDHRVVMYDFHSVWHPHFDREIRSLVARAREEDNRAAEATT